LKQKLILVAVQEIGIFKLFLEMTVMYGTYISSKEEHVEKGEFINILAKNKKNYCTKNKLISIFWLLIFI
jgi:hypothetical protein